MGTKEKQEEIRSLLKRMRWRLRTLANAIIDYEGDLGDIKLSGDGDPDAMYERVRGHFKRDSTPEEIFDHYLKVIMDHIDYESLKLDHIRPNFVPHDCLDEDFQSQLAKISVSLNKGKKIKKL